MQPLTPPPKKDRTNGAKEWKIVDNVSFSLVSDTNEVFYFSRFLEEKPNQSQGGHVTASSRTVNDKGILILILILVPTLQLGLPMRPRRPGRCINVARARSPAVAGPCGRGGRVHSRPVANGREPAVRRCSFLGNQKRDGQRIHLLGKDDTSLFYHSRGFCRARGR